MRSIGGCNLRGHPQEAALVTLTDLTRGFRLTAYCMCGHAAEPDPARLAAVRGWDQELTGIRRLLRCSACGSREVSVRIAYSGGIVFRHDGMRALAAWPGAGTGQP